MDWIFVVAVHSIISDSLWPRGMQHARLPCLSLSPRVCSNSCSLSQWYRPTISSSVTPLLLLPSIFPSIRVFSNELALHIRWPKYWSFSFGISPSSEHSGLISFVTESSSSVQLLSHVWLFVQHSRLPCPSPTPRACSNSCPLSWWCHPTISSSVIPFSSHLQSFPASGSFPVSQLFASGGQSIRASASTTVSFTNRYQLSGDHWQITEILRWVFKGT